MVSRIEPGVLDEIRARIVLSDIVGRRVQLQRCGREHKGLSPFVEERTPSFTVNDSKGFYHCFSSGRHGDAIQFLREVEGLSFAEAVGLLAKEAGVDLGRQSTPRNIGREGSLAACRVAARYYAASLTSPAGEAALAYLEGRGIGAQARAKFQLGWSPATPHGLIVEMSKAGLDRQTARVAGLLVGDSYRALFRERIMFPIRDGMGEVIGFGGRRLDGAPGPKYLNSPETLIYSKRRNVFNFAGARASAAKSGKFIAVEGYLDAITVDHAGIENVVAVLGTAINPEQLRTLWKTAPEVVVVLDGDAAGRAAADRAIDAILPEASATSAARFAWLDAGVDPDDLVRESGVEAFRAAVERSMGLEEALWRRELARVGVLDAPERRSRAIDGILNAVAAIRDERTRALYHAALARRIELEFEIGRRLDLGTAIHDAEVNVGGL